MTQAMRAFCVDIVRDADRARPRAPERRALGVSTRSVAKSANDKLVALGDGDPGKRIISYVLSATAPLAWMTGRGFARVSPTGSSANERSHPGAGSTADAVVAAWASSERSGAADCA